MKFRKHLLCVLSFTLAVLCPAQDISNSILLSVDGKGVEAGEFIRMFRKSIEPGSESDFDSYLQQFIVFKLKVAEAMHEGIDTTRSFRNELSGYRQQLAAAYLTDADTKEKLITLAYSRSLTDIKASHILVMLPANATPADTLEAWTRATGIRKRIIDGHDFGALAKAESDDPSAKTNEGNLGYFTVFQMVKPFEDAAYSLKKGEISQPVKSPYGYHIIRLDDTRPSPGKVHVAHIMKSAPPGADSKVAEEAGKQIQDIYKKLKEGASFKTLARDFSDHKESAVNGGELTWFGTGEIIGDFSEAAFALTDTGSFTKPVRTTYGWHIIKLLGRKPPGSLEESRAWLESRIDPSYVDAVSKKSFSDNLKKAYSFKINKSVSDWFVNNTDTLIMKGEKKYDSTLVPAGNIYTFADQKMTATGFATEVERRKVTLPGPGIGDYIGRTIEEVAGEHLTRYEDSVLERKYPEFRYLMNEFHDGILLFEISNNKVWSRVSKDSLGLVDYYNTRRLSLSPVPKDIEEVRGEMMRGYQEYLENEWIGQLKARYAVKIDNTVKENVRAVLKNE